MSYSKSGRLSLAEVDAMTKQQLKSYLTSFDQRLPAEERNKEYYKQRVLTFMRLQLGDEESSENDSPLPSRPRRGRRASAMAADSGHGTTVTMRRNRHKTQSPSPLRRAQRRTVVSSANRRRGSDGEQQHAAPTPSPSSRRRQQVPTSGGRKKTPTSVSRSLKRKRLRMRSNTTDPDFLLRLADEVEREEAEEKRTAPKFPFDGVAARHTVRELKRWLTRHGIEFEQRGKLKQYYVDLVADHSYVRQSPKRPLSPLSKHSNVSPPKKVRTNQDVPSANVKEPVPPNLDPEALTPQKPASPPRRIAARHATEGLQIEGSESPTGGTEHHTEGGNLLTTPLLVKRGVPKVSRSAERRMRDEIRSMLLDDEDEFATRGGAASQASVSGSEGKSATSDEKREGTAPHMLSPQGMWAGVSGLFGSHSKPTVPQNERPKQDVSPLHVYNVPIRSQQLLAADSPLRKPPKRVPVEEDEEPAPQRAQNPVNEDEVDTEYEESPPASSDRGFHPFHQAVPEESNSPFPMQRLVFPSSRHADKRERRTPPVHVATIPEKTSADFRHNHNHSKPVNKQEPSKAPATLFNPLLRHNPGARVPADEPQKPTFLSPEKPPFSVSPSPRTQAKRGNPLKTSTLVAGTLLTVLLAVAAGYLHDTTLATQRKFLQKAVDKVQQVMAQNVGSDSPLFCDRYTKSIAGRRDSNGDPIPCQQCPENAQSCAKGVAKCRKGYILQGSACVVDQEIVRLGHEISYQVATLLSEKRGKHECGWDVEADMTEAELLGFVQLSQPSQLSNAFAYFKTKVVPDSNRVSYDPQTQRYSSAHAIKPIGCQLQQWVWQNLLGVVSGVAGLVLFAYLGVTLWVSRNDSKHAELLRKVVYDVLDEQQNFNPNVPFLSLDHMRQRLGNPRNTVWQRLQSLVETDPSVQKSMRMVDGLQKPCWKLSQTPLPNRAEQRQAHWQQPAESQTQAQRQGQAHVQEPALQFSDSDQTKKNKHSIYSPARSFGITPAAIRRFWSRRPQQQQKPQVAPAQMPAHSEPKYNPWG